MTTLIENTRKPNLKKWICPIDGKAINSRGAPAYLRNKYKISWDKKFLRNAELLREKMIYHENNQLYVSIIQLFSDIDSNDKELKNLTIEEIYKLIVRIRINLRNNDTSRILLIHKLIFPITSSKLVIRKKNQ
jgi:hypothetical protein